MARLGVFVLLALAAIAQASLPSNNAQDAAQAVLRPSFPVLQQKAKPLCKECEKVVALLEKILDNPETEQKLQEILTDACNLPVLSNFRNTCLNLVNDVVVVIHELQSIFSDPTKFCDSIKMCVNEASGMNSVAKRLLLSAVSKIVQDVHQPSPPKAIDTCGLCTSALSEVKHWLEDPQFVEKIEDELEKVCKYLGPYQQTCDDLLQKYVPKLFGAVVEALCQPEQTCAALHLCKSSLVTNVYQVNRAPAAVSHPHLDRFLANISAIQSRVNFGCLACKTGVGAVLKYLRKDNVENNMVKDITDFVCKILPSSQRDGCFDFLGIYGKPALQLTVNEWTPSQICTAVHACSSGAANRLETVPDFGKSKIACDTCKVLSKVLAVELQKPELQQDIINVFSSGCRLMPGKYSHKCESYIQTYFPYLIDDIVVLYDVPQLCTVLRVC